MHEDLENEVEVINSIYGEGTLEPADRADIYILHLPDRDTTLRIQLAPEYPDVPPAILGTHHAGEQMKKGEAAHVLEIFRESVGRLFQPGAVCLYDVIEDVSRSLDAGSFNDDQANQANQKDRAVETAEKSVVSTNAIQDLETPPWTVSDVVTELKSVFVARCAPVTSPDHAKKYLQHLLDHDKKVAKATHNITAYRIKVGENGVTFQDCDDDGETAAGGRLLHLMQLMDLWNVMVVVTRWYGGQKLGPARFGIINSVARDAFVKGGFVQEDTSKKKKQ